MFLFDIGTVASWDVLHMMKRDLMSESVNILYTGGVKLLGINLDIMVPAGESLGGVYILVVFILFPVSYWLFRKGKCV